MEIIIIIFRPTSTKPQAEILKLNNVNGCNDISFGDHSILEGDCIIITLLSVLFAIFSGCSLYCCWIRL